MLHHRLRAVAGRNRIPTDGLIAHYTMDTISGTTLVDETGTYDATINGATVATGVIGDALSFDGVNDTVTSIGSPTGLSDFTASLWFNTSPTGTEVLFDQTMQANRRSLILLSGGIVFYSRDSDGGYQTTQIIPGYQDGFWHHAVFSQIGVNLLLRVDDTDEETLTMPSRNGAVGLGVLGFRKDGLDLYYSGKLDVVRVYNRELTPSEKTSLFNEV